ncbi:MAG: DUF3341 domain-containing protein [Chloroflexi bacterium AL-W]|nr:DUF3341 domain-containing protein [Chloroflexi bacterium AL-W]
MKRNLLIGKYWDPDKVMAALDKLTGQGVNIFDVFSPFPIHGIEPYLNAKRTRLTVASFIYGVTGFLTAVTMMSLIYGVVWPMNIGGKPALAFPSFVPITFEMTVLFAAHGIVLTFFIVGNYWPGKRAQLLDIRQTDDVFIVAIDKAKIQDESAIRAVFEETGAYDILETEYER